MSSVYLKIHHRFWLAFAVAVLLNISNQGVFAQPTLGSGVLTGSGFQFTISGPSGAQVTVLASQDLVNWTTLGQPSLSSGGSYSFVDTAAASLVNRFYVVNEAGTCSANIYGFITVTVPGSGQALIADQMINPSGNTLAVLLPAPPNGTIVNKWDPVSQAFVASIYARNAWSGGNATLNPGEGAVIQNGGTTSWNVTFIGNVPQGQQANNGIPSVSGKQAIISSIIPRSAGLDVLGFPAVVGDVVDHWNTASQAYDTPFTFIGRGVNAWTPSTPTPALGEAFWIQSGETASRTWTETLSTCPPTVLLTSPAAGSVFVAAANISLSATATASAGVQKVDFYQGTTLLGTATAGPNNSYNYAWSSVAGGNYSVTAKATDNNGVTTISTPLSATVLPFTPPAALETPVTAQVQTTVPTIILNFPANFPSSIPPGYTTIQNSIYRRAKGSTSWGSPIASGVTGNSYSDADPNAIHVGSAYEYQVVRTFSAPTYPDRVLTGSIYAGIQVPLVDQRGKIILLMDNTFSTSLMSQLTQLVDDLTGDGWTVLSHIVNRGPEPRLADGSFNADWTSDNAQRVKEIRAIIQADYNADPANVKAVFLFGHIPVPYSGEINPDGHPDHLGAWPSDGFYGDILTSYGVPGWTDISINELAENNAPTRNENYNIPGDGKFDQNNPPNPTLLIGRVDLYNMPSFTAGEQALLSQYLTKNHNFKNRVFSVQRRALGGSFRGGNPADFVGPFSGFFESGWNGLFPLFGNQFTIPDGGIDGTFWFPYLNNISDDHLWGFGSGFGFYNQAQSVGNTSSPNNSPSGSDPTGTDNFVATSSHAVFTALFGSYFGDWDNVDNFLRAPLANSGYGLSCFWGGSGLNEAYFLGLGETIGYTGLRTEVDANNNTARLGFGLMGDPTLRLHVVAPVSQVMVNNAIVGNPVSLTWNRSPEDIGDSGDNFVGYNIYRAPSRQGPFNLVNTSGPVNDPNYLDSQVTYQAPADPSGSYTAYMVRAVKLESSPSGTYYNASEGVIQTNSGTVAPQIRSGPANQIVTIGAVQGFANNFIAPVAFAVWASGTSLSYQWSKDGQTLSGATSSLFLISNPQTSDAGTYTVVVSNGVGQATASATLTVNVGPTFSAGALTGSGFQFTISGSSGAQVTVLGSQDLVNWTTLGQPSLSSGGSYNFVDTSAASLPNRFYALTQGGKCSANTYGFINVTIPGSGKALIADQLINPSGNTLSTLLPAPPNGTEVNKWDPVSQAFVPSIYAHGSWSDSTPTLNPGEGALIQNGGTTSWTVTFIGTVPQWEQANNGIPGTSGKQAIISSIIPQSAGLDALGFPAAAGDVVNQWNMTAQAYNTPFSFPGRGGNGWSPSTPVPALGEAFWIQSGETASRTWMETLAIYPPTVALSSPAGGSVFLAGNNINLSATATGPAGVQKVDFYQGTTLLGTATTAPYSYTWNNVAAGSYSLTAKATDNNGVTTVSTPASIAVH